MEENLAVTPVWVPHMMWSTELGERSPEILHARIRAKWYGARVITYRPYILAILDIGKFAAGEMGKVQNIYHQSVHAPPVNQNATCAEELGDAVLTYARKGLLALVHSTSAFHEVADPGTQRLIVTNIWGTAHA